MKQVPIKDFQVLLDDDKFHRAFGANTKWQTYAFGKTVRLCAEFNEVVHATAIANLQEYCQYRRLDVAVRVHPEKQDWLLVTVSKSFVGRLTKRRLTLPVPKEGNAKRAYSALQKAIARNGGKLVGGATAYEAKNFAAILN